MQIGLVWSFWLAKGMPGLLGLTFPLVVACLPAIRAFILPALFDAEALEKFDGVHEAKEVTISADLDDVDEFDSWLDAEEGAAASATSPA